MIKRLKISKDLYDSSDESCTSHKSEVSDIFVIKRSKKKKRQSSLLKSGFVIKDSRHRSPTTSLESTNRWNDRRCFQSSPVVKEVANIIVTIHGDVFVVKEQLPQDTETTVGMTLEEICGKFENETGCRWKLNPRTLEVIDLSNDDTVDAMPREKNLVRLVVELVENEVTSIVENSDSGSVHSNGQHRT